MDIKALILAKITKNGHIKSSDITRDTGFSRTYINRFLNELENEGAIIALGKTRQTVYVFSDQKDIDVARRQINNFLRKFDSKGLDEERIFQQIDKETGIFMELKENIHSVLHYAFTEMLNNAIDHAYSKHITVAAHRFPSRVWFSIIDTGVGVFNSVQKKFDLPNTTDTIGLLIKGKQTTDPKRHTGQGIFFTSKMADAFNLLSSNKNLRYVKKLDDYFIDDHKTKPGTMVSFSISTTSDTDATKIFAQYTNNEFGFDKTKVIVKLYKNKEGLLSRSEARRIMFGLEKFSEIIFDFKDVPVIGQGFADEIFRVWQNNFPDKKIQHINANENVEAMIKMAINY
ncbi:MAG: hypothetical protein A2261_00140 [Candidatus Magasanikbacteria bacterium RIFOXYA2_FULL_44_8]|uniref:DUF4325 domain-containing protein n=1 Tax=Candidatus Magasanikbacteria bacterium RIFOXYA2_FULL_44_8 TaxID=1798696 RepID=A0A1F6NK26_9BACT|nr:MAG: hypothetical protein A2261_00140 [Candidatus Magasanikbacteria bacterium RIFOXYA2_FULL_44_8]